MKKSDKFKIETELRFRSDNIIRIAKKAQEAYVAYKLTPNLNNYKEFRALTDEFYLDGNEPNTSNAPNANNQPISMLKTFKTKYPKAYKKVVKELEENNIDYTVLVDCKNAKLEHFNYKQQKRLDNFNVLKQDTFSIPLKKEFGTHVVDNALSQMESYINNVQNYESTSVNPEFEQIDMMDFLEKNLTIARDSMLYTRKEKQKEIEEDIAKIIDERKPKPEKDNGPELTR